MTKPLSERLDALIQKFGLAFEDADVVCEAIALARRVEGDRAVSWQKRYAKIPRHVGDESWSDWEQCSKLTHDNIQIGVRMGDASRQARALVPVEGGA